MKKLLIGIGTFALAAAFTAAAQQQTPPVQGQAQGRGRGLAPRAFGDRDKDGKCDVTGRPVGQGRAQMMQGKRGRMGGRVAGRMGGRAGMGFRGQTNQAPAPAQPEAK